MRGFLLPEDKQLIQLDRNETYRRTDALKPADDAVCWPNIPECSAWVTYSLFEFPCPILR